MATFDIVVIAAGPYTLDQECLDLLDPREGCDIAGSRRHLALPNFVKQLASESFALLIN